MIARCGVEERCFLDVVPSIDLGTRIKENLEDVDASTRGRIRKRGSPAGIGLVDGSASCLSEFQEFDGLCIADSQEGR